MMNTMDESALKSAYKLVPTLTEAVGRTCIELQAETAKRHNRIIASLDMVLHLMKKNHLHINPKI